MTNGAATAEPAAAEAGGDATEPQVKTKKSKKLKKDPKATVGEPDAAAAAAAADVGEADEQQGPARTNGHAAVTDASVKDGKKKKKKAKQTDAAAEPGAGLLSTSALSILVERKP